MPFLSKCHRCGWTTLAKTRWALEQIQSDHDSESHKDELSKHHGFPSWATSIISSTDYNVLVIAMRETTFWRVYRDLGKNPAII
jgi:hypothetical protein